MDGVASLGYLLNPSSGGDQSLMSDLPMGLGLGPLTCDRVKKKSLSALSVTWCIVCWAHVKMFLRQEGRGTCSIETDRILTNIVDDACS